MCMTVGKLGEFGRETIFGAKAPRAAPGQTRDFHAGEHLFFEGDTQTHIFLVVSGWVKLYRTLVDGQRQVVGFVNEGSVIGLESDIEHSNGCQAVTEAAVRSIPVARIAQICATDQNLAQQLLGQLGRQLGAAQSHLATVGAQSAEQKLASFLISICDLAGASQNGLFHLPMRRGEMAEFLGLRLETVSRQMAEFQRCRWIEMSAMYDCRILRRDVLNELALGGEAEHAPKRMTCSIRTRRSLAA